MVLGIASQSSGSLRKPPLGCISFNAVGNDTLIILKSRKVEMDTMALLSFLCQALHCALKDRLQEDVRRGQRIGTYR